jgi:hypothetical protein
VGNPKELADKKRVLARIELWIKTGPKLQEGRDLTPNFNLTDRGLKNAGQHLQHGALPCTIRSNHGNGFTRLNTKVNVTQCPKLATLGVAAIPQDRISQLAFLAES